MNILNEKAGPITVWDGLAIGAGMIVTERVLSRVPFVGNGTFRSGLIKGIGGVALSMGFKNRVVGYAAAGMLIDGMGDLYNAAFVRNGNSVEAYI